MKRLISLLLIFTLALPLLGCSREIPDQGSFYYRRAKFQYGVENGVIVSEPRDITGHVGELYYLLSLYLMGPLEEGLESPFPRSTRLVAVSTRDGTVHVKLTGIGANFPDAQFSLACACLTLTCLELTGAEEVTILSGDRTVTMNAESLLLQDGITNKSTGG